MTKKQGLKHKCSPKGRIPRNGRPLAWDWYEVSDQRFDENPEDFGNWLIEFMHESTVWRILRKNRGIRDHWETHSEKISDLQYRMAEDQKVDSYMEDENEYIAYLDKILGR